MKITLRVLEEGMEEKNIIIFICNHSQAQKVYPKSNT